MSGLETRMRHRDRDMVPRALVQGMFALMLTALGIVAYAQWSGTPNVGMLREAPIVAERAITMSGDRSGTYAVTDADGVLLATSSDDKAGFIGVIGRVIDRQRDVHDKPSDAPLRLVRRENGNVAIIDTTTDLSVELIGYGADNVAAFARLID